jgi:hypothetical protein
VKPRIIGWMFGTPIIEVQSKPEINKESSNGKDDKEKSSSEEKENNKETSSDVAGSSKITTKNRSKNEVDLTNRLS